MYEIGVSITLLTAQKQKKNEVTIGPLAPHKMH